MTILVKNQYVELRFRLLGARWGRVMADFIFFSGPGTIFWGEISSNDGVFFEKSVFGIPGVFTLGDFSCDHPRQKSICPTSFRLLGARWGRVMTDLILFFPARGPSPLERILPMGKIRLKGHGWAKNKNNIPRPQLGQN